MDFSFDKKDVFSWSNAEEARQYIGKEGYFSDYFPSNLEGWVTGELKGVSPNNSVTTIFSNGAFEYGLFLPADKAKQSEKKWRPFKTVGEFQNTLNVGFVSILVYRRKDEPDTEYVSMFTGYKRYQPTDSLYSVVLGGMSFTVENLLDKYEWYNAQTEEWCPFGVEE